MENKIIDDQIKELKNKKVLFKLINEEEAKIQLKTNINYFRIQSYLQNYNNEECDFQELIDLSIIDLQLRKIIISTCLDIEYFIKLQIINNINSKDTDEIKEINLIINSIVKKDKKWKEKIAKTSTKDKYSNWVVKNNKKWNASSFFEACNFGSVIYYLIMDGVLSEKINDPTLNKIKIYLSAIKNLRNIAAHNSLMLNELNLPNGIDEEVHKIQNFIDWNNSISTKTKREYELNSNNMFINDFASLTIVISMFKNYRAINKRIEEINHWFNSDKRLNDLKNISKNKKLIERLELLHRLFEEICFK